MVLTSILMFLTVLLLTNMSSQQIEIPGWIKDNAEKITTQNNPRQDIMSILENLSNAGIIKNTIPADAPTYEIPPRGKTTFVPLSGNVNEYGASGSVLLEIYKPDNTQEFLRTPILETGFYSTVYLIDTQSQKGTYRVLVEFNDKQISTSYFSIAGLDYLSERIPSWFVAIFQWWTKNKISDADFIQCIQYLVDNKILIIVVSNQDISELHVLVEGQHQIRRGTTHTIISHVTYGDKPVEGARVTLSIKDYNENIIREFNGFTTNDGEFIFSWEIPKKFDNVETLLAFIDVTYGDSSVTQLFKFQVYCLPGESNCKVRGN